MDNCPSVGLNSGLPAKTPVEGWVLPRDMGELEEAFVRLHALERRVPGGGRWPFARDIPGHLIAPEIAGEWSETLLVTEAGKELPVRKIDSLAPRSPLDTREVAEYERLKGWLMLAPASERSLVWEAAKMLERGEPRPAFGELKRMLKYPRTAQRLGQVYRLALWRIVAQLNGRTRQWATRQAAR